jgi:hypothetical protein
MDEKCGGTGHDEEPSKDWEVFGVSVKTVGLSLGLCLLLSCLLLVPQAFSQSRNGGILEVRVKDHREAIADFAKLEITVDRVRVSAKAGFTFWQVGWRDLNPSRERIDLTQFTGKRAATVFKGEIESGGFDAIHLNIREIEGILKKDRRLVEVKNVVNPIKLLFSVREKVETVIVLDLVVLDLSDHPPRGYELHVKGYELYSNGKLIDKIPPG